MKSLRGTNPVIQGNNHNITRRRQQNQRVMNILISMMVFFFICWTLYYIFVILFELLQNVSVKNIQEIVHVFCHYLLPYLSTAFNPLILFVLSTNYRQGLMTCFHAVGKCRSCLALRDGVQEENDELREL